MNSKEADKKQMVVAEPTWVDGPFGDLFCGAAKIALIGIGIVVVYHMIPPMLRTTKKIIEATKDLNGVIRL